MEKTYWNDTGKYQEVFHILWGKYVPSVGEVRLDNRELEGAIEGMRCANNVYYDVCNNGGCNIVDDWYGEDHFIRDDYAMSFSKIDKFYDTEWLQDRLIKGTKTMDMDRYMDDISNEIEKMMNAVLEAAIKLEAKTIEIC